VKEQNAFIPANGDQNSNKVIIIKIAIIVCIVFALADFAYKTINNINPANREQCIVYKMLPGPAFILFENLVELPVIIFLSIFSGLFLQRLFNRLRFPVFVGPLKTFFTASLLPICSCSSVSLLGGMGKIFNIKNTLIFFIAAPLLNPFIILMSVNILGVKYCLLRIMGAFLLSLSAGYLIHFIQPETKPADQTGPACIKEGACVEKKLNPYIKGMRIFKNLIPFFLFGAGLSIVFNLVLGNPFEVMKGILQSIFSKAGIVLLGIPLYICGGADILILKPLLHAGLPLGTALSFTLTAASVCIPSVLMIGRLLGKKIIISLIIYIVTFSFVYGELINTIPI
jgi:uncharacterized membrane protein YraQ (UPF0718 family)